MLPGSLTLKWEQKQEENITLTHVSISSSNNLDFTKRQEHSPFRATHNRTDNQCGQDTKLTNPMQSEHHLFLFFLRCLQQQRAPNQQTVADALQIRVNPLIAQKEKVDWRGGKKSAACCGWSQIWNMGCHRLPGMNTGSAFLCRLWLCKRLLHSGAEAHIDEESVQGCCCCCWWRWRHSACSN